MSRPPADPPSSQPPFVLDAMVLAHGGLTWEHEFRGVRFERIADAALSAEPTVQARLQFGLYNQQPVVNGVLVAELELTCQRCLQPVRHRVEERFELMLVDSEAGCDEMPEQFEPWVVNATHADVFGLIEEQLVLALPLIARHDDVTICERNLAAAMPDAVIEAADERVQPAAEQRNVPAGATVQTPFSNLRELLHKR